MKTYTAKIISALLICLLIFAAVPTAFAADTEATVNEKPCAVGETIEYKYMVTSDIPVVNAEFTVNYDPEFLTAVPSTSEEDFPAFGGVGVTYNFTEGAIYFNATNASRDDAELYDFSDGAYICDIKFTVKKAGATTVSMNIETIGGKNDNGIFEDEIDLYVNNAPVDGVTEKVEVIVSEKPGAQWKLGDVNHDEAIDSTDATLVLQRYADIINDNTEGYYKEQADVDGVNDVDSTDATLILQYFAEIIKAFPAEG